MQRFITITAFATALVLSACTATAPVDNTDANSASSVLTESGGIDTMMAESGSTMDQSASGDMIDTTDTDTTTGYENPDDNARD